MLSVNQQHPEGGQQAAVNTTTLIDELEAQAGLYRLCGRLLEGEIDSPLLALLRGELREPLAEAGVITDTSFIEDSEEELLERLAQEYTGLLVAPGAAMPYASVFETGRMFQEPADRAEKAYRAAGWVFNNQLSGEFPDHVGVMLSFHAIQLQAQADACRVGDDEAAKSIEERSTGFLIEQVGSWVPGWCRMAAKASYEPFYQQLLTLVEQSLWVDLSAAVGSNEGLKKLAELNRREPPKLDYDADFRKASGL
tara:strand:+ start:3888 stop:4646 length:759 start_codon:yes stop_codon:yes gene_type:complete